ncbi:DUF58 domain-containing protein [Saccharibacillus endophyticus]|uniref:DUF58 domain-containing protein n=1 Tax=Saccharibacillus endophyticus TaxID=2060666 RepID=A0ABQ2A3A4_9BACL|nr:DUF58 domain-containing protein [Saccharibacillus endophyticus]GGH85338.1 hypothetical protein GCM10007362_42540 [Saccharibacillus endophyticus]
MALIWMMLTAALLVTLQAQLLGRFSMRGIRYHRSFNHDRCHAGEDLEMIEVIENDKRLPVAWLRLESEFPAAFRFRGQPSQKMELGSVYQTHTSGFALMPRRRVIRRHFLTCEGRGIFQLSTVFMTSGDLFGFIEQARSENIKTPLIVYPALLDHARLPLSWHNWQGDLSVRRWIMEDPFLIEGSREYAAGDPMNRIDWKASARTGGLQVYKQGYSADPNVMIVLDIGKVVPGLQSGGGEAEAEHAISLAATCATSLSASGVPVGFVHNAHSLNERRIPSGSGAVQRQLIMEAMAGIRLQQKNTLSDCLIEEARQSRQGLAKDYLVITSADPANIGQACKQLEHLGHRVSVIDPGEPSAVTLAKSAKVDRAADRKEVGA